MIKFKVTQVTNGYVVSVENAGTGKKAIADNHSFHVFKNTEEFQLLEFIGQLVCEYRIKVERR
jgi:hypothetical protein